MVTGHTGFKGAWLVEWLLSLECEVAGFSLQEEVSEPALFPLLKQSNRILDIRGDLRSSATLSEAVRQIQPEFIFHLAAQPIVRRSYKDPVATYETNVMGTIRLLEVIREFDNQCVVVIVTSDKCYLNQEWMHAYREDDSLGGHDPYSASKACVELVVASYRNSFFQQSSGVFLASGRAGNVIGGGDWGQDRILPDCVKALSSGTSIHLRNPGATRPWQFVLEPLGGYLLLAASIDAAAADGDRERLRELCAPFNFGPDSRSNRSVDILVREVLKHWPGEMTVEQDSSAPHEAGKLNLAADTAYHLLGWHPVWDFERTIAETVSWYRNFLDSGRSEEIADFTRRQINAYSADGTTLSINSK
jgi:CDP-glucose 4,6-dehydratase